MTEFDDKIAEIERRLEEESKHYEVVEDEEESDESEKVIGIRCYDKSGFSVVFLPPLELSKGEIDGHVYVGADDYLHDGEEGKVPWETHTQESCDLEKWYGWSTVEMDVVEIEK